MVLEHQKCCSFVNLLICTLASWCVAGNRARPQCVLSACRKLSGCQKLHISAVQLCVVATLSVTMLRNHYAITMSVCNMV